MEELLSKLIEKGWKPRGFEKIYNFGIENGYTVLDTKKATYISFATSCIFREDYGEEQEMDYVSYTFRELVSKESGLWQFVCENGMYKKEVLGIYFNDERAKNVFYKIDQFDEEGDVIQTGDMEGDRFIHMSEPEYRLIESALKDESELEDFLLQNIKL